MTNLTWSKWKHSHQCWTLNISPNFFKKDVTIFIPIFFCQVRREGGPDQLRGRLLHRPAARSPPPLQVQPGQAVRRHHGHHRRLFLRGGRGGRTRRFPLLSGRGSGAHLHRRQSFCRHEGNFDLFRHPGPGLICVLFLFFIGSAMACFFCRRNLIFSHVDVAVFPL